MLRWLLLVEILCCFHSVERVLLKATSFNILALNVTPHRRFGLSELRIRKTPLMLCSAKKHDRYGHGYGYGHDPGRLVDENMFVLHKRIDELRAADGADPEGLLFDWAEWERDYYYAGRYGSDVDGVVGLIRLVLMRTRPSVAIGLVAILILGVPTSMALVGFHLVDAFRSMFN